MSRTFKHKPMKFIFDWTGDEPWKEEYGKYSNVKCQLLARGDRRRIRHSLIDDENKNLTNAIAEYKKDISARDRYW
jgi:malate/lactate dehydrogenase